MKKLVNILVLMLSGLVLLTAMNQSFINGLKQDRYFDHLDITDKPSIWYRKVLVRSDRWRFGDLYGICFLPAYKFPLEPYKRYSSLKKPVTNRVLYIVGDSFLADKILTSAFDKFDNVIYLDRRFPVGAIKPDSTKQNYIISEFAERYLNDYKFSSSPEIKGSSSEKNPFFFNRIGKIIFNRDLSRNLEQLLFEDRIFTPVKELKAVINEELTDRVAKEIVVSTDKRRLLYNVTVDTASIQSAFKSKTEVEIDSIAHQLNAEQRYYLSKGFKAVFLSVIPNPVTLYDSHRLNYNHLLERVEKATTISVISSYKSFINDPRNLFYKSDSHWNPDGFNKWVGLTNQFLNSHVH